MNSTNLDEVPSGKGMSFLSNKLMLETPSPRLTIIDIGSSCKNLCENVGGVKQVLLVGSASSLDK